MNKKLLSVSAATFILGSAMVGCGANNEAGPDDYNDGATGVNFNQYGNLQVRNVNDTPNNEDLVVDDETNPAPLVEDEGNGPINDLNGNDDANLGEADDNADLDIIEDEATKDNDEGPAEEAKEGTELEDIDDQPDENNDEMENNNEKGKQNKGNNAATNKAKGKPFADVAENEWYTANISWTKQTGVLNGMPGGEFQPNKPMTRAQVATMLKNLYDQGYLVIPNGQENTELDVTYE